MTDRATLDAPTLDADVIIVGGGLNGPALALALAQAGLRVTVLDALPLEIRDVRYQGNKYWVYSIEVSSRTFVTNAHPLAVKRGRKTKLQLVGHHLLEAPDAETAVAIMGGEEAE